MEPGLLEMTEEAKGELSGCYGSPNTTIPYPNGIFLELNIG